MTTKITIEVPNNVNYMVKVIQEDKVIPTDSEAATSYWNRNVSADVYLNAGEVYTTHIWDTKRILIEEVHN